LTITAIVCAYNEAGHLPVCIHSLLAQTRPADEILVINNASTDDTGRVAREIARCAPSVRVVDEPAKGLVVARETARRNARGSVLAYVDADCRVPLRWLERVEAQFAASARSFSSPAVAVTGPYRFYDWDAAGRAIIGLYDVLVAPPTHVAIHHVLGIGAILYGGNFAARADALERIGGFDETIEFHGEDTNLGRRLAAIGRVRMCPDCWVWTSARRYVAMGKRKVFSLYVRNFWSEILRHRPADREHLDVRA
jgi:glycosyltransferase involved in cell wall biosynthesis